MLQEFKSRAFYCCADKFTHTGRYQAHETPGRLKTYLDTYNQKPHPCHFKSKNIQFLAGGMEKLRPHQLNNSA